MGRKNSVAAHYSSGTLLQRIEAGLQAEGHSPPIDLEILSPVDEFHIGGRLATEPLLTNLGLNSGHRALDLGCGLGGSSRFAAQSTGAKVTGIDLTDEFVQTGRALNDLTGLSEQVELVQGSILDLPFDDETFDVAFMLHVGMNIADKVRLAREAARVLKPGGRFGIYDVMQVGAGDLPFPVPWASEPGQNALSPTAQYHEALEAAGFETVSETDRSDLAREFFAQRSAEQNAAGVPPSLGVHLTMGADAPTKIVNMVQVVMTGLVAPIEIVARKPG